MWFECLQLILTSAWFLVPLQFIRLMFSVAKNFWFGMTRQLRAVNLPIEVLMATVVLTPESAVQAIRDGNTEPLIPYKPAKAE
jgi:hypothetical protein